ncbi:MAG TPA: helix-turn-helix domain-containing protein [Bryobacteraceae bacterium]|nr:helix-turn-helix domain-containing protein [Bryobacteraceae bacterium]
MIYEEFRPAPPLIDIVSSYWRFALPSSHEPPVMQHAIPPDGAVNLCWVPPGRTVIVGPRVTALRVPVHAGAEYLGARFLPGAGGSILGISISSLRDAVIRFESDAFASAIAERGLAGIEGVLLDHVARDGWKGPDTTVVELARRIVECDGALPVSALVAGLNVSYRQVLRRFREAAGLTPKEFARLRRLRAASLQAVRSTELRWADVSADTGFSDQSHLSREFQDVYGWPPRLVHEYLRRIEHRTLDA